MRRRYGFTLVELLMVIAIISLLVALLVPTLKTAMDESAVSLCEKNHLTLILAVQAYAMEHDSSLPFPNWASASKDEQWKANTNLAGWLYDYPLPATPGSKDVETGSLWPHIRSRKDYRCPRHNPPYNDGSTRPVEVLTSYVMNGAAVRYANVSRMVPYKIEQMPTDGICFWEADETQTGGSWDDGSNLPSDGITQRHINGATVGCFGGHVRWMSLADFNSEENNDPGRLWCAPTSNGH